MKERMRLVAQRADDGNTHDIGFIFWLFPAPMVGRYNKRNTRWILVARYREGETVRNLRLKSIAPPIRSLAADGVTRDNGKQMNESRARSS